MDGAVGNEVKRALTSKEVITSLVPAFMILFLVSIKCRGLNTPKTHLKLLPYSSHTTAPSR